MARLISAECRPGHAAELLFRFRTHAGEYQGDMVAGVSVAGAAHNDPVAENTAAVPGAGHGNSHFSPFVKRPVAAEFDAVSVDGNRVRGQFQIHVGRTNADGSVESTVASISFCTHK